MHDSSQVNWFPHKSYVNFRFKLEFLMDFKKNFFGFMAFTILRENKYLILTLVTAVFHRVQLLFSVQYDWR